MRIASTEIYDDFQRKLITGFFRPGSKLKPSSLQGAYGCSANTVRDVLLRLSRVGLVEFEMQRGFRAREASPQRRSDIARFRILLEQTGAALSIENGDLEWEVKLSAAHHKLVHVERQMDRSERSQEEVEVWSDAEREFHETLISRCDSPVLRETYANIYVQFRQQIVFQERNFEGDFYKVIIREHQSIVDAALARNTEACKQAIYDHVKRNL